VGLCNVRLVMTCSLRLLLIKAVNATRLKLIKPSETPFTYCSTRASICGWVVGKKGNIQKRTATVCRSGCSSLAKSCPLKPNETLKPKTLKRLGIFLCGSRSETALFVWDLRVRVRRTKRLTCV
jgi:hypothetical protein